MCVLGSPSLIVGMVSVDVKQHLKTKKKKKEEEEVEEEEEDEDAGRSRRRRKRRRTTTTTSRFGRMVEDGSNFMLLGPSDVSRPTGCHTIQPELKD